MVSRSRSSEGQRQTGWLPPLRALWSLCWRLSIMLLFLGGALWSLLIGHWWASVGCVNGFIVAAVVIRRLSTVEHRESSGDGIVFL
jgi:TRAP-type C4-dicarboxylate transport system permease large subunit